ncbi:MAG: hypothetical protein KDA62_04825 [Planctomycetales bacterium]|nr:hypothetical protein [Planctomycetales bacterium]
MFERSFDEIAVARFAGTTDHVQPCFRTTVRLSAERPAIAGHEPLKPTRFGKEA